METYEYVSRKSHEKFRRKFVIHFPGILVPSKSSMCGSWRRPFRTPALTCSKLHCVRKCKAVKLAVDHGSFETSRSVYPVTQRCTQKACVFSSATVGSPNDGYTLATRSLRPCMVTVTECEGSEARNFQWTYTTVVSCGFHPVLWFEGKNTGRVCSSERRWTLYLGPKGRKKQETGENCVLMSFMLCTFYQILCRWSHEGR